MKKTLTREYYREQMQEFRKMMGDKTYWQLSDDKQNTKIELAFKGLFHVYLNTDGLNEEDKMLTEALVEEFSHRKMLMEIYGIK